MLINNVQIICKLIGQEEYKIGRIVFLTPNIVLFDKKATTSNNIRNLWRKKNRNLLIKK